MIILDEQISNSELKEAIESWYKSKVSYVKELRPQTIIKDDVIPLLLRRCKQPTFVTINYNDFWGRKQIAASPSYCIACFKLERDRWREVSGLLRDILSRDEFATKKKRMGKVISWSDGRVTY
jgi:hypothetical protein